MDKYVPDGDYVVIKFARWAFEKFKGVEDKLGTQMRAVGEVMSIGKTYKEAFQKAIRSLETGRYGLGHANNFDTLTKEELSDEQLEFYISQFNEIEELDLENFNEEEFLNLLISPISARIVAAPIMPIPGMV